MTTPAPIEGLPTEQHGGLLLCHVCRLWRPVEYVRPLEGVQTCTTCAHDPDLDTRPAELAAAEAPVDAPAKRARKAPARKARGK
jgi:hypothetical protein